MKALFMILGLLALFDVTSADACDGVDCGPDGVCQSHEYSYICNCSEGLTGQHCQDTTFRCGCGQTDGVLCPICDEDDPVTCDANIVYELCHMSDPVCEAEEHINENGQVTRFRRVCKQREACLARTLGPATKICDQQAHHNNICRWCECPGFCGNGPCPDEQDLYCFTCEAKTEVICWLSGRYAKATRDSSCYHQYRVKSRSHPGVVSRGSQKKKHCWSQGNGLNLYQCKAYGNGTETVVCSNCDNGIVPIEHFYPAMPRFHCGEDRRGMCGCKGDPHCVTFDGAHIDQLDAGCWHIFARDGCVDGKIATPPTFVVSIKIRQVRQVGKWSIVAVKIEADGVTLRFYQIHGEYYLNANNLELVNGNNAVAGSTIVIYFSKDHEAVRITLPNGVEVNWDYLRTVNTWVPEAFQGVTCGICGDFNGQVIGDIVYGPSSNGTGSCPQQDTRKTLNSEGTTADISISGKDFAMTWFSERDIFDMDCSEDCDLPVPP